LPVELRLPRSNFTAGNRCVVSSGVSTTMDEKCSFRARSEMESAETTSPATQTEDTHTAANNNARTMLSPSETITPVKRLIVTEISLERHAISRQASPEAPASTRRDSPQQWTPSAESLWGKRAHSFARWRIPEFPRVP